MIVHKNLMRNVENYNSALTIWGNFPRFLLFYGGGIRHNEDIMHSFQNFIVRLIPNHPPPLETRIWKLVVRALNYKQNACFLLASIDAFMLDNIIINTNFEASQNDRFW